MTTENCYLLLEKKKLQMSKAEILKYVKDGSNSPRQCEVIMNASMAQGSHYDFVRYCDHFVTTWGLASYVVIYAPSNYLSYLLIKFQHALAFHMTVPTTDFITPEIAVMFFDYQKSCYSRPLNTQHERIQACRKKIDKALGIDQ
jgi:hypothetical protein